MDDMTGHDVEQRHQGIQAAHEQTRAEAERRVAAEEQVETLQATIARVEALHQPFVSGETFCNECGEPVPCCTIKALRGYES